jgi:phosphate acetyltransferase
MKEEFGGGEGFLASLRRRAAARLRTLAFPEGAEPRVLDAVVEIQRDRLARPVLIGPLDEVRAGLRARGVEPRDFALISTTDDDRIARTLAHVRGRRAERNDSEESLAAMAADPLMQAGAMIASGEVSGAVAGCVRTTADVVRAALVCVGLTEGLQTLSSAFYMVFDEGHAAGPAVLTFTDAGVVPEPSARQLAEIAMSAAAARPGVVGDEPRVAFLSYSTLGSADGESIERIRHALAHFRERAPNVKADGELQGDAALSPRVAARKAPGSPVAGEANVLVFPDLGAANVSYKLVQYLGGAVALGPILQGLACPFNDLFRGAVASDIVSVACITSLMAE